MKERPILFSGDMVRAILEGRKTVTRRVVKCLDPDRLGETMSRAQWRQVNRELPESFGVTYFCPYGKPGDRLWVRETWSTLSIFDSLKPSEMDKDYAGTIRYKASGFRSGKLRPSIFMPRWASRILLEITAVRVERLQDISEEQARAEGMLSWEFQDCDGDPRLDGRPFINTQWHWELQENEHDGYGCASYAFQGLWKSINGAEAWAANPWVWVVEFKALEVTRG